MTSWSRPALVLVLYLGLAAAGLAWSSSRGHPFVWRMAARPDPEVLLGALGGLIMGLGVVFASRLSIYRFEWARALHRDFRARIGPLPDSEIVILALASSIGEEVFFRGALMPVVGLGLSSLAFAALHVGPKLRHLAWTASSFVVGMMLAQLFKWSGDLTGPVIAHFTVNFLNLRYIAAHELR